MLKGQGGVSELSLNTLALCSSEVVSTNFRETRWVAGAVILRVQCARGTSGSKERVATDDTLESVRATSDAGPQMLTFRP